jgi:hypothetical protein
VAEGCLEPQITPAAWTVTGRAGAVPVPDDVFDDLIKSGSALTQSSLIGADD